MTDLGDGLEMRNGDDSWMTPRFQLAQLSGRVRWGHWEEARFGGSLSQDMVSLRNLWDIPGEAESGQWDL